MCNRQISYGYQIVNGVVQIVEDEAKIVKQIFDEYIKINNLNQIAMRLNEQQIPFYQNEVNWNKNKIDRIIRNIKYLGNEKYIAIIDKETFYLANEMKNQKGHKKIECSPKMDFLKTITYCENCGRLLIRRVQMGKKERWYCKNGCLLKKPIEDLTMEEGIKHAISKMESSINNCQNQSEPTYHQTAEIMKYTNEIYRSMKEQNISSQSIKQMILKAASLKFESCCEDNYKIYTLKVLEETKKAIIENNLSLDYLQSNIKKISVNESLILRVQLKNGIELVSGEAS